MPTPLNPKPLTKSTAFPEALFQQWIAKEKQEIMDRLSRLVQINTVAPNEHKAFPLLKSWLDDLGFEHREEPMHPDLEQHYYFTDHPLSHHQSGRVNLRSVKPQAGADKICFSTHVDVVPASNNFTNPFAGQWENEVLTARGACDTKNNIVMLLESLRFLKEAGIRYQHELLIDFVVEEEIGGNGALSTLLHGLEADWVCVMEPTSFEIFRGHRGCIQFNITLNGKPAHMGAKHTAISAIDCAIEVIEDLKVLEQKLIAEAKKHPAFARWEYPVQINVGRLEGGEWHGSTPAQAKILGNLGFAPWYSLTEAKQILIDLLQQHQNPWIREHFEMSFDGIQNDAYLMDRETPITDRLKNIITTYTTHDQEAHAWNVSCDARFYFKLLDIPTIIFGCGDLALAHSDQESISWKELSHGIKILAHFLMADSSC